jgi:hypothetical protein
MQQTIYRTRPIQLDPQSIRSSKAKVRSINALYIKEKVIYCSKEHFRNEDIFY